MVKNMAKKPKKCTYPDCFSCPYFDCIVDGLTMGEYIEAENRDKEYGEPKAPREYTQRSFDCEGRKEYFRKYYQENREHKLRTIREYQKRIGWKYDKDRSEYYKKYYQEHKEKKIRMAIDREKKIREALNATG